MAEEKWPKLSHYAEACRLRTAYADAVSNDPDLAPRLGHLMTLAQLHATLAVADELRETRQSAREIGLAGLPPGARRELLP